MVIRITQNVLRVCALVALILGILFWTNVVAVTNATQGIHMLFGILVALSLIVLGIVFGTTRGGNWGLAAVAIVLAIVMTGFGMSQTSMMPENHWVIQVIHLLLGLCAIGVGEMIGARARRLRASSKLA
ncbi:MAG TPA: hypothetical protein VHZ51_18745 [Ktedonobacteraceae bacterium]|jgi:hypothetical protein|nr:hypothetical protein [Ktedonobacteraceae bacterium]